MRYAVRLVLVAAIVAAAVLLAGVTLYSTDRPCYMPSVCGPMFWQYVVS